PNVMPAFSSLRRIMGWASHCGVSLRTTCFWNRGNRDPPRPPLGLPTFAERAAWGILQVRAFDALRARCPSAHGSSGTTTA
ncbi:unnamed protein product, partial [Prorocentrum cordatum]